MSTFINKLFFCQVETLFLICCDLQTSSIQIASIHKEALGPFPAFCSYIGLTYAYIYIFCNFLDLLSVYCLAKILSPILFSFCLPRVEIGLLSFPS